jgi:hypothetical protein
MRLTFCIVTVKLLVFSTLLFAQKTQYDTIYTNNNKFAATIKEVSETNIKFNYPDEDLLNSIYKNLVVKVRHKSGRIEIFKESQSFPIIKTGADWEKVIISGRESDVNGLFRIGEISSNAKGATTASNTNKVKKRAIEKLKVEAALQGGNIIIFLDQNTEGAHQTLNKTLTSLTGIAYTNVLPEYNSFKKTIKTSDHFHILNGYYLKNGSPGLKEYNPNTKEETFTISKSRIENNFIYVSLKETVRNPNASEYRVTYFDDSNLVLMYRYKGDIFSLSLSK